MVHTAPSLELLAQTPSNFNLWYWFNDASRQYCCSNAFRAVPNCEAHNSGTSCFIQRSHRELGIQSFTKIVESNGLFEKRRMQILLIIIWKFVLQSVVNDYDREKWPIITGHARMQTTLTFQLISFCFSVKLKKMITDIELSPLKLLHLFFASLTNLISYKILLLFVQFTSK